MKNVSNKKKWNIGVLQVHVEPSPTPLIKSNHDDKSEKDFVKLKLRRDPTSENSDLCKFKMGLFDNGKPVQFLLFVSNFRRKKI